MQESQTAQSNTGLIYGLNDRPPVREAIFAAIQHLLAIFVAIITPPLMPQVFLPLSNADG